MKLKATLILLLTFQIVSSFGQRTVNYLRTNDYDRLRLSIDDFKKIISSIQYYYNETPEDSTGRYRTITFKCDFSKKNKALTLASFKQVSELNLDGENYSDIVLIYSWDTKPISEVTLFLNSSYRKLSVSGADEKKVEALFRDIDSQLKSNETTLSWINWEMVFVMATTLIFVIAMQFFFLTRRIVFSKERSRQVTVLFILTGIYCFASIIFFFSSISFRDILPGFLLTPDKTTWIDRNINLLGFIAFILTVIPIIYKTTKWILEGHTNKEIETSNEDENKH